MELLIIFTIQNSGIRQRMMASKLEQLKKRMLTKKNDKVDMPSPQQPDDLGTTPQQLNTQNAVAKSQEVPAIQGSASQDDSFSQSKSPKETDKIENKPKQSLPEESVSKQQPVAAQHVQEEPIRQKVSLFQVVQEQHENKVVSAQQISQKDNNYSLELAREPFFSASVDEQIKHCIQQKINELSKPYDDQNKVEKKTQKIVLKELIKVKQCIKNLQSAIKGLQYVQQKIKHYPSLKERVKGYITELKQLNH